MPRNPAYILGFAAIVCVVCAVVVSSAAVSLKEMQEANLAAYRQQNVLVAAGLVEADQTVTATEIEQMFTEFDAVVIDLATGAPAPEIDPVGFDQRRASADPERSSAAPQNAARVRRLPDHALVYERRGDDGALQMVILPIEGMGLWSTLYGYLALDADLRTIRGITYYEHRETPGLGGEVDNTRWKALWPGRLAFDESQEVAITVLKGPAGPVDEDPYRVDGLSGATLTSRGVTNMLVFWLGDDGFGPYLDRLRGESS